MPDESPHKPPKLPGGKNQKNKKGQGRKPPNPWASLIMYALLGVWLIWLWQSGMNASSVEQIPYSKFKEHLAAGEVVEVTIMPEVIEGIIKSDEAPADSAEGEPEKPVEEVMEEEAGASEDGASEEDGTIDFRTVRVEDPDLVKELQEAGVEYTAVQPNPLVEFFWTWVLPIGLIVVLWLVISRYMMGRASGQALTFGRSKAKIYAEKTTGVNFGDVAGCDEAKEELVEVVDFLQHPQRYSTIGAKVPKGVLLVGPPGTGKTLLARAVAGEAGVTFFFISGSDFVEMFVGVGASRVRDLFTQATQKAPCIVFIDELDAIGRQRGVHMGAVNDEREQTLNQLLVEMDGFEPNNGVIILAATNRPEVLDRALLRPGRFDRQVVLDAPDLSGREAILKVHAKGKPFADDVDFHRIAQGTPGFSGADLANAVNEAALLAVRRGNKKIAQKDLEEAVEKVVAGPERKSRRLNEEEKRRVAYHEVGHALVSLHSKHADPVHKISIVPRGKSALGYTLQLPTEDHFLMTEEELLDRIKGLLGGRAAEEVVFGDISTGAQNDLERVTAMARQMVCYYGMSDKIGLAHCAQPPTSPYLQGNDGFFQRDCSEETAREIDEEVKRILDAAYEDAKGILKEHSDQLERIAQTLLERETLTGHDFEKLAKGEKPEDGKGPAGETSEDEKKATA